MFENKNIYLQTILLQIMYIYIYIYIYKKRSGIKLPTRVDVQLNITKPNKVLAMGAHPFLLCKLLLKWSNENVLPVLKNAKYIYLYMSWMLFNTKSCLYIYFDYIWFVKE